MYLLYTYLYNIHFATFFTLMFLYYVFYIFQMSKKKIRTYTDFRMSYFKFIKNDPFIKNEIILLFF